MLIRSTWGPPPEPVPHPVGDEVHLWRVRLSGECERHWRALLTAEERHRADRFRVAADRHRFTVTRGILRAVLGKYFRAAPESLCFDYNRFGKPSLEPAHNPGGITFNVSHSGCFSLLAFGLAPHLGVDVERLRPETRIDDVARTAFSPAECAGLLALPHMVRRKAFFDAWVRTEATVKALGAGLSLPRETWAVEGAGPARWCIQNIEVGQGYAAAIAVGGRNPDFRLWDWVALCPAEARGVRVRPSSYVRTDRASLSSSTSRGLPGPLS
jgi:4'-phosphopantetheinyl transferase